MTRRVDLPTGLETREGDAETVMGTRLAMAVEVGPPGLPAGSKAESADAQTPHRRIDNSVLAAPLGPLSRPRQASQSTPWDPASAIRLLNCWRAWWRAFTATRVYWIGASGLRQQLNDT